MWKRKIFEQFFEEEVMDYKTLNKDDYQQIEKEKREKAQDRQIADFYYSFKNDPSLLRKARTSKNYVLNYMAMQYDMHTNKELNDLKKGKIK